MILAAGEIIHIVERRAFESDVRRHFAGRVDAVELPALRATGFVYAFHVGRRTFERRDVERTRVFPLDDARLIINVLPATVDPGGLAYRWGKDETLVVREGEWSMDLTEFAWASL